MKKYVTYGFKKFDKSKVRIDLTCFVGKPRTAWWGSPIDAKFGWKEWCTNEYWTPGDEPIEEYFAEDNKVLWTLTEDSKILYINNVEDLDTFIDLGFIFNCNQDSDYGEWKWDFHKVLEAGYTAIELTDSYIGHYFTSYAELLINGWDCESIVVLDPSKIIPLDT